MHSPGWQPPTTPQVFVDIIQVTGFVGSPFASQFYTLSMLTKAGFVAVPHSDPPPGSTRTISTGDSLGYQLLLVVVYYILTWCVVQLRVRAVACNCALWQNPGTACLSTLTTLPVLTTVAGTLAKCLPVT